MLEVIGVGFGRTGTASLKVALEHLGLGPCYHMFEVLERPDRARDWNAAVSGEPVDWERVFAGYRATTDWPAAAFWRDLVDAYPTAKVVLTVRDPEAWYDSGARTFFPMLLPPATWTDRLFRRVAMANPALHEFQRMANRVIVERAFDGHLGDRRWAIEVFERHVREVRDHVDPQRLLVFEVASGWQPLCDFLGVPVPDTPFPRVNDSESFRRQGRQRMLRSLALPAAAVGAAALGAAGIALASRRRR